MVDRLAELKLPGGGGRRAPSAEAVAVPISWDAVPRDSIAAAALALPAAARSDDDGETAALAAAPGMERFFGEVGEVKEQLAELRRRLREDSPGARALAALFREHHASVDTAQAARLAPLIEAATADITALATACQARLKELQRETDTLEQEQRAVLEAGYTGAEVRARRNIVSTLADTAAKLVEEFMELQSEHAAVHRKTVARRVEIAVGDGVSAEEKERVVEQCLVRTPQIPSFDHPSQLVRNSLLAMMKTEDGVSRRGVCGRSTAGRSSSKPCRAAPPCKPRRRCARSSPSSMKSRRSRRTSESSRRCSRSWRCL